MHGDLHGMVARGARELDRPGAPPLAALSTASITGTMLADLVRCEQRVHLDLHGDPAVRMGVNPFVEMLWSQGHRHETAVISSLGGTVVDLSAMPLAERRAATADAMRTSADWILGARLSTGDMDGRPDLLHRIDATWVAGDVKSGSPWAPSGGKPRQEYAVHVGFYGFLMHELGVGDWTRAFVIGSGGEPAFYDLEKPSARDGGSISTTVAVLIDRARAIRDRRTETRPALSSACGLCVWRSLCKQRLAAEGDLTLVPGLGRSIRGAVEKVAPSLAHLAEVDVGALTLAAGRTSLPGVGADRLSTFRERARMLVSSAPPFAIRELGLARRDVEHHLDLETDPTCADGDFTYLHGIWRRRRRADGVDICDYVHFLAADFMQEREAFAAAVAFLTAQEGALLTTFSAFERSTYRRLAARYPEVIDQAGVDALFAPSDCIDLYFDAVLPSTHWPVHSLGLKSIARHLGFEWSASDASGAASIQWFVEWTRTRENALLERILTYNRDDCMASAVVFDGLLALPVMPSLPWPQEARP